MLRSTSLMNGTPSMTQNVDGGLPHCQAASLQDHAAAAPRVRANELGTPRFPLAPLAQSPENSPEDTLTATPTVPKRPAWNPTVQQQVTDDSKCSGPTMFAWPDIVPPPVAA